LGSARRCAASRRPARSGPPRRNRTWRPSPARCDRADPMLVRAPRIVRFLSVSRSDTWPVTPGRKPSSPMRRAPAGEAQSFDTRALERTPIPPAALSAWVAELTALVGELSSLAAGPGGWSLRVLRRNLELARLNPETLLSAENQLDFIEELAEAAWDSDCHDRSCTGSEALTAQQHRGREERRRAALDRLGEIALHLCAAAEGWW